MEVLKTLHVTTRNKWRAWLKKNYLTEKEVWLVFYKKHTRQPRIPYDDAVEEALCFGWIDSTIKRLDDEKYAQKFSPRKNNLNWSDLNKSRVRKLIKEGTMTQYGLSKVTFPLDETPVNNNALDRKKELDIPPLVKKALKENEPAWENFCNLAPSYRRIYILWITDAKKEETRIKRINEAIGLLKQNKKLGMK